MSDRELVLARIRAAIGDVPPDEPSFWDASAAEDPAARYVRWTDTPRPELSALFAERCREYRGHVTRCEDEPDAIMRAVSDACVRHQAGTLAAPVDICDAWCPDDLAVRRDRPTLTVAELDACDGVLSACALAVAVTGTIVLDAGVGQGRRALSLVPDLLICVVRCEQIVGGLPEAFDRLAEPIGQGSPVTFISGPSATSDIELRRVEGVHGPRRLEVLLAGALNPD